MTERTEETGRLEASYLDALGKPPPQVTDGALASIFAATTRRPRATSPLAGRRLALAGAAAAAGVAALAVLKREGGQELNEEALDLAGLDLELLDELELCRDLEVVELLELLEEMDDG